jgi:peptidoglycan biosynthesis protein MviN/MurJ (putative lipid II flippase)
VVARTFGANGVVDFVILAQLLPVLFVGVVSSGVVLTLPSLFRSACARGADPNDASAAVLGFSHRILRVELVLLGTAGMATGLALTTFVHAPFRAAPLLVGMLCMQALIDSAIALYTQVLQLRGRFAGPAFQSAANGLVSVLVVVVLAPSLGIWAWPLGLLLDSVWQVTYLRMAASGVTSSAVSRRDATVSLAVASPSVLLFALTLVFALTDRIAGPLLGAGVLALWFWSLRIGSGIANVFILPIATVAFTRGHVAGAQEPRLQARALIAAAALAALAAAVFFAMGSWLVNALFGSSALDAQQLKTLTTLVKYAVLAGVPAAVYAVSSRALMARAHYWPAVWAFALGACFYPASLAVGAWATGPEAFGIAYLVASVISGAWCLVAAMQRGVIDFRWRALC